MFTLTSGLLPVIEKVSSTDAGTEILNECDCGQFLVLGLVWSGMLKQVDFDVYPVLFLPEFLVACLLCKNLQLFFLKNYKLKTKNGSF